MSRRTPPARSSTFTRHVVALALLTGVGAALLCAPACAQGVEPADTLANPGRASFDAPPPAAGTPETAPAPRPAPRVAGVTVVGQVLVDSMRVLRSFDVQPGSAYDARAVQQGLRRLWATNLFDDLEVLGQTRSDGVHLVVRVAERPKIAGIVLTGVDKLKEEDLNKHLGIQAGDSWRPALLAAARDSVLLQYRNEGYRETEVVASADSGVGGMRILFAVTENKKAKITGYRIEGVHAYETKEVTKQLASGKAGFPFKSGTVKEEKLEEDLKKLHAFYRERGYRDVRVERLPFTPDPKGKGLILGYQIHEGPIYRMGEVRWQGNEAVPLEGLKSLPQPTPMGAYNGTRIQDAVSGAYSLYAEAGYLYVNIEPTEMVRDSNVVDLAFQITEGPPSHVREVRIVGNTYTKENVIRRELELHEGDLFRRSRLMNSQQGIFRLGYFGDVGVDFQGVDSADVDVIIKIKEKQTGTAQAGAGYSSDGGLTGFLNLGHNNLFGNGQSVNIALERGGRRRNVELSFTDPWFHDTPLSVGGSAFISSRDVGTSDIYTDYREQRRGFSVQVGRPIPHVRYTRGTLRYQLEIVDISVNSINASPSLLALATAGDVLTSSIEASLTRNSTNNPFYPTKGQRGLFSSEFAGGPLGGDFSFNKTRLDSRWYFHSLRKDAAHMIRLRLGGLGAYAKGDSVPVYERFRLGGVTIDGLRGYDDYSIVPRENETFPRYNPGSLVGIGSFAREPVPYPGGRFFSIITLEEQFAIVHPVHGVVFAEAGNVWNRFGDIRLGDARKSVGFGLRVELPVLGNVGFDYAYGFDKVNPGWRGHFLLGAALF